MELKEIFHQVNREFFNNRNPRYYLLKGDASGRKYYRICDECSSFILCINDNLNEAHRFIYITRKLYPFIPLIHICRVYDNCSAYVSEDLGDVTMSSILPHLDSDKQIQAYQTAIDLLFNFHFSGYALVRDDDKIPDFSGEMLREPLQLFKDEFLCYENFGKFMTPELENLLEEIYEVCNEMVTTGLLMMDFQPRNLMIHQNRMRLIDYQDCYYGNVFYDLAGLLYSGSHRLDKDIIRQLLIEFLNKCQFEMDPESSTRGFAAFALLRRIRSYGTYGKMEIRKRNPSYQGKISFNGLVIKDIMANFPNLFDYSPLEKFVNEVSTDDENFEEIFN